MTNRIAVYITLVLAIALGIDIFANEGRAAMFLLVKFADLVEWVAFWR